MHYERLGIKEPNWNIMSANIDKDFTQDEQLIGVYVNAGLTLGDLKQHTMKECNMMYNASEISSYKEFQIQIANHVKPKT